MRYQEYFTDDAEVIFVAFGSIARICLKAIEDAREAGIKVGLIRPITLWPFPTKVLSEISRRVKGMMVVELNAGQMVEDVRLAVEGRIPVYHYGRMGGCIPNPQEVLENMQSHFPDMK